MLGVGNPVYVRVIEIMDFTAGRFAGANPKRIVLFKKTAGLLFVFVRKLLVGRIAAGNLDLKKIDLIDPGDFTKRFGCILMITARVRQVHAAVDKKCEQQNQRSVKGAMSQNSFQFAISHKLLAVNVK